MDKIVISKKIPKTQLYKELEDQVKKGIISKEEMLKKLSGDYHMIEGKK